MINKKSIRLILSILYLLGLGIVYYFYLPVLNIQSLETWVFLIGALLGFSILHIFLGLKTPKSALYLSGVGVGILAIIFVGKFFNSTIFRASDYASMIEVEEKVFSEDFRENDTSGIPLLDRNTAVRLGDRQIGGMSDLVSQFVPASDYTQINIGSEPYRVSPMEYASPFKWWTNHEGGVPGYLQVDMVDGTVELVNDKGSIKYSDSEYFNRNVKRYLRFKYPTTIFESPSFEVDDSGTPYYVATTYQTKFFFNVKEPNGVITLNAITGETTEYKLDETPDWIDRVYSARLIIKQLDNYGKYQDGYLNALFSQKGVTRTTKGYNYLSFGEDVFLYTGVTSANSDASNIGFYLVNMRTKEAEYYPIVSADETSAAESAIGAVQQMGYESTFPILINLQDRPYYLSSLKDNSGLVRLYALVDAQDYQKVCTHETVEGVINKLNTNDTTTNEEETIQEVETEEELVEITGEIEKISQAVIAGDTVYYFLINGEIYKAKISLHDQLPFIEEGKLIDGLVNDSKEIKKIQFK